MLIYLLSTDGLIQPFKMNSQQQKSFGFARRKPAILFDL